MSDVDENTQTTFWIVWDPQGDNPVRQYPSEPFAVVESVRMARELPGHSFYVMESICVTVREDVTTRKFTRRQF